jgi:hypothetical protein
LAQHSRRENLHNIEHSILRLHHRFRSIRNTPPATLRVRRGRSTQESALTINRREFLLSSASLAVMASRLNGISREQAQTGPSGAEWPGSGKPSPLVNYNCATLIGLGDEPPGFLDQLGQPGGRRTQVLLDLDYPVKPFQNDAITPDWDWAQWLENGYLP